MTTTHVETAIVGAGQAGLVTAYYLQQHGRERLVLDAEERIGDNWRQQWDSLRLYTPAKYDSLPGLPFPKERWSYPHKDEVADYLECYARHWTLPVQLGARVDRLEPNTSGFTLRLGDETITCDNVVVATGSFGRTPHVPDFAAELDASVRQLHSSQYRRPSQLQDGKVLVVGAAHSGTDLAYELALTHEVVLCGRDPGELSVRLDSKKARLGFPVFIFVFRHLMTRRTPIGRKEFPNARFHGGPALRVKRTDLRDRSVERITERMIGVRDGLPLLADGRVVDARNVVWCTGFQQAFGWIDLPVFDESGWPVEYRGVVADAPGLFFCGLSFQFAFASMGLWGVGRDAKYVARRIIQRSHALAA